MVKFDYTLLLGNIIVKFGSRSAFASAVGISTVSLYKKITGDIPFKQDEMYRIMMALDVPIEKVHDFFFTVDSKQN